MRRLAFLAGLLLASAASQAQTTLATPLPPAKNGVITPGAGSRVDPHMPVMHPKMPGRTPVIRPPGHTAGGRTVIDPR